MNLYQHAKNLATSSFHTINIIDLKIQQSDWPITLWPISHELDMLGISDLNRNIANNFKFHCRLNSEKINDQNFQ